MNQRIANLAVTSFTHKNLHYTFRVTDSVIKNGSWCIGNFLYNNAFIQIVTCINVDEWYFCIEKNKLLSHERDAFFITAFIGDGHYVFEGPFSIEKGLYNKVLIDWLVTYILPLTGSF